jgi:transcriptional regulator with XRE-family HTH domain
MTARKSRRKAVAKRKVEAPADAVSSLDDAAATLRAGLQSVLVRGLGALAGGVPERIAASASGVGLRVGKALLLSPESARMRREAGRTLRELRKVAGLTVDELAEAVELSDHSLLAAVEKGTATLSFELILRLSALLARNDPVPFVVQMTRTYNPALWKLLEGWGIVRIPLQMERERRFLNVYRAHDAARKLSDESFDHVLGFTQSAFEMALHLAAAEEGLDENGAKRTARRKRRPPRQNV